MQSRILFPETTGLAAGVEEASTFVGCRQTRGVDTYVEKERRMHDKLTSNGTSSRCVSQILDCMKHRFMGKIRVLKRCQVG